MRWNAKTPYSPSGASTGPAREQQLAYTIEYTEDPRIAKVLFDDRADFAQIYQANLDLAPDGKFVVNRRLWDFSHCEMDLLPKEIKAISDQSILLDSGRQSRIAIVVDDDVEFGLSSIYRGYGWSEERDIQVFRHFDAAEAWLRAPMAGD